MLFCQQIRLEVQVAITGQPPMILSIDDDLQVSQMLCDLLDQAGYCTSSYQDGALALAAMAAGSLRPDLILLDLVMPGIDGYGVCRQLQAEPDWAMIPVVFLTGADKTAHRLKTFQAGAVGFLEKPILPRELLAQVEKFLKVGQSWQQSFTAAKKPDGTVISRLSESEPQADKTQPVLEPARQGALVPIQRTGLVGFRHFLSRFTGKDLPEHLNPDQLYLLCDSLEISPEQLARLVASYTHLTFLDTLSPDQVRIGVLPVPFCRKYLTLAIAHGDGTAFVLSNPFYLELEDALHRFGKWPRFIAAPATIERLFGSPLTPHLPAPPTASLEEVVYEIHNLNQPESEDLDLADAGDENAAPVIRLVNRLIEQAYRMRASDIHLEPAESELLVRYRIDGELRDITHLHPARLIQTLAARIKIMAGLNIAEKRLPQDGRIVFKDFGNHQFDLDLRVSTAPMIHGEKIVMRLIDKQKSTLPLQDLGFSERNLSLYRTQLNSPYGMVLHVGPTGSGKSMTMYAALNELRKPGINILTVEDPVEYTLPGINQLQVKAEIGLTFERVLRAFLRQDPDVILVGEIRDHETAEVALEAALTGHLLLSTLHTNNAASTLTRFLEMGFEPYLISASVIMICAQRLLRCLCPACRQPVSASPEQKQLLRWPEDLNLTLYQAPGCADCNGSGYLGRLGVHELLIPSETLRQTLGLPGITAEALMKQAVAEGMTTLFWDGVDKCLKGLTSLDEVCGHIRADEFDSRPSWWIERSKQPFRLT